MSINYKCNRCCKFETCFFNDMKKHYTRKYLCSSAQSSILYSCDQLLCLSLIPYNDNIHKIELSEVEHLKKSNILDKNKTELFEELKIIEKNNIKICKHCNKDFYLITDLKKHFIIECFYNNIKNKEIEKLKKLNNIDVNTQCNNVYNNPDINTLNNTTNNNTTNNNNNNINIIIDPLKTKNTPIPFDEEWDISKISKGDKTSLIVSQFMYTELLEEILKNDINLNVIIDKDNDSAMVYKNNVDKYIQMKLKDIISNTMDKLNVHLNDINKNDTRSFHDIIKFSRQMINKKYNDFKNSEEIQKGVKKCMSTIYDNKKDNAIIMAKNIICDDDIEEYRI